MDTHYSVTRWLLIQKIKHKDDAVFFIQLDYRCFVQTMQEKLIRLKIKDDAVFSVGLLMFCSNQARRAYYIKNQR
jgi:hypothetical protein